ncbi:MAG: FKBP-type peptidyl-prolyl cis-trans isomerase [Myxococcales bacterium]|nr:FKBP-type peptidyl-prolyl cis-trans isomerase [Myxococcales bacterium]
MRKSVQLWMPGALLCALLSAMAGGCNKSAQPAAKKEQGKDPSASAETPKKADEAKPAGKPGDIPAPSDVAAPPADAEKTASGLASKVLKKGAGEKKPREFDKVKVHYTGWKTDGKMFDSSVKRGSPETFGVKQVIPGWTEALQLMKVGEKRRLWIPAELAYKNRPGPQGMLVFDVELLEIIEGKAPIPAPEDVAGPPDDAQKTESGLAYKVLEKGTGKSKPRAHDRVVVNYTGWTTDGKMFDSSVTRGQPATFAVGKVIAGWTEGLQLMVEGEKRRLWIPQDLAYKGRPGPPKGMLVFDVELVKIEKMPDPPKTPKDVAGPPASAKKTESGLAYKVLKRGKGKDHPKATDRVKVHYSGWTTDGKMFDSSVTRGQPTSFALNRVIPGWTEGVQLMVEGETTRFWIPEELAYKGRPGAPQGMLVFDVELLEIVSKGSSEATTAAKTATKPDDKSAKPAEGAKVADKPAEGAKAGDKPAEGAKAADKPAEGAEAADKPAKPAGHP